MIERTQLGKMILGHWQENRPQMVRDLERENRLEEAVDEAQKRTGDLFYELISVQRMDYQAAWEIAMRERFCRARPAGRNPRRRNRDRAGDVFVAGLPDRRIPPDRTGEPAREGRC